MGLLEGLGGGSSGLCGKEGMMLEGPGELLRLSLALFKSATGSEETNVSQDTQVVLHETANR